MTERTFPLVQYVGTKLLGAHPMTLGKYNELRGWAIPRNENPDAEGYLVEYADGGEPNHRHFSGYISWSPKTVFEASYAASGSLNFGHALELLNRGHRMARSGWNGKNMFIFLVPGSTFKVNRPPLLGIYEEGTEINYHPHIDMRTADGQIVPWLASQSDVLANDWAVVQ